jgi:hypothetical protein
MVAMIGAFAVHQADRSISSQLPLKWLGFVGTSAIVFGYAIRANRPFLRARKFWLFLFVFFLAHLGVGVLILARADTVPLSIYAVLTTLEYALLTAYLGLVLDGK